MLEVMLVIFLSKKVAEIVRDKGRGPTGYVVALVILWILGEVAGFVAAEVVMDEEPGFAAYLFALVGAALGALAAFGLALAVPARPGEHRFGGHTGGFPVIQPSPGGPQYPPPYAGYPQAGAYPAAGGYPPAGYPPQAVAYPPQPVPPPPSSPQRL